MGRGSVEADQRAKFLKVAKHNWKVKVVDDITAIDMIKKIRSSSIASDTYAQKKITALEAYILYCSAEGYNNPHRMNFAEFFTRNPQFHGI